MEVTGVSRLGIGSTTVTGENLLLNLTVGAAGTEHIAGTGATMFNIDTFKVARNGYAFQIGDVLTVSGLVTAAHLTEPVADFQLEVTEIFNDFFLPGHLVNWIILIALLVIKTVLELDSHSARK